MTFTEYLQKVAEEKELHPEWRMGQTYFNVLQVVRPDLAEPIRGSYIFDTFHRDEVIGAFLNHVCQEWEVTDA